MDGWVISRLAVLVVSIVTLGMFAARASADPFVYVANNGDDTASQFAAGAGGALGPDSPATVATGNGPAGLAVSPDGSSVYLTNEVDGTVSEFDVGPGGVLSPKGTATIATGTYPQGVAVSPDGSSVYVANEFDDTVSQFNVGAGGRLSPKSTATVSTGTDPSAVAISPNGSSLYVTNLADGTVSEFDVGAGGVLTPMTPAAVVTGSEPLGVAVSRDGSSVYVTNFSDGTVSEFDVGAGGVLTPKSSATAATGSEPYGVAVSPDGSSVYVTNFIDGTVSQFAVSAGGVLTPMSSATAATGDFPQGIAVRPPPAVLGVSPASGPFSGGTQITIRGSGFVSGATVEIGQGSGASATAIPATNVTVVSSTEITATTGGPAKRGSWNVFVTDSGGTSFPNPGDLFTYTRPAVSGVSPGSGPVSGGTPITITGSDFLPGATVEIGQGSGASPTAIPATNVDVVSSTEITATTGGPARHGRWNLFVLDPGATSPANNHDLYTYAVASPVSRAARAHPRAARRRQQG